MRIANIMLSRGQGGLEQAFVDYTLGLREAGAELLAITHPDAKVNPTVEACDVSHVTLPNRGKWDWATAPKLQALLHSWRPDCVICHGGRAVLFGAKAMSGEVPLIGVGHNYRFRFLDRMDYFFVITHHMKGVMSAQGIAPAERVWVTPNSIAVKGGFIRSVWPEPVRIGTMGRFVEKKGFDIYIEALALLKQRGYPFRASLGGGGALEARLKALVQERDLAQEVHFPGWIKDKAAFLKGLDIFCLPSHHEPFGIVLLEAMAAKLPIVSTDSEGPVEILEQGFNGLLVPRGDAAAMADAIAACLDDQDSARRMATEAYARVRKHFSRERVMPHILEAIETICADYERRRAPVSNAWKNRRIPPMSISMQPSFVRLIDRAVLKIGGEDARAFLQGLVTNDMRRVAADRTIFAALLSAQGKFQFDFFIGLMGEDFLLELDRERIPALERTLKLFKLRSKVTIAPMLDMATFAVLGAKAAKRIGATGGEGDTMRPGGPIVSIYLDPRYKALGARVIAARPGEGDAWLVAKGLALARPEAYERLRLAEGIPEGSRDALIDRTILLENGYDRLNGVDFAKGCYVGQEVTARSKHKAVLRKLLCQVSAEGELPPPGTPILAGAMEIGEMRSSCHDLGMALIRLDRLQAAGEGSELLAAGLAVRITRPFWHPERTEAFE